MAMVVFCVSIKITPAPHPPFKRSCCFNELETGIVLTLLTAQVSRQLSDDVWRWAGQQLEGSSETSAEEGMNGWKRGVQRVKERGGSWKVSSFFLQSVIDI